MGCGWSEMVGELTIVTVGKGNQVFGIGVSEDCVRRLYMRSGVTYSDLSGRTWREVCQFTKTKKFSISSCFFLSFFF